MQNISTVLESLSFYLESIQPFEFLVSLNPRFIPDQFFLSGTIQVWKKVPEVVDLEFIDLWIPRRFQRANNVRYILVTRAIDVGFHRITKQIFRFCYKYTGFVSTRQTNRLLFSLCFSFLFTPCWTFQALYRLNRVSARAQKFMQRTLTSPPIIPANDPPPCKRPV